MASPIERLQRRTGVPDEEARVVEIDDADEVLDALAADTRRAAFRALFEEPGTPSELAERLDTSVQNTHYHVTTLQEAGLVEPIDAVYSEKGNEMTVYGPASDPIVLVGQADRIPRVKRSLSEVVTGLGLLAVASLFVQWGAERLLRTAGGPADNVAPTSTAPADPASAETLLWLVFAVLEPGLLFFAGCLAVAGLVAWFSGR